MKHSTRHRTRRSRHVRSAQGKLPSYQAQRNDQARARRGKSVPARKQSALQKQQRPEAGANEPLRSRTFAFYVLAAAIGISLGVSVWLRLQLNFNAAYVDEADYLFVGRMLWLGKPWPTHTYIFSSDLPLYLLGLGDQLGGLIGGRVISGLCGLVSLYSFYRAVLLLFNDRQVALLAVLLLGIQAPHLFISKFATYDVICLAFFATALWLFIAACVGQGKSVLLLGSGAGLTFFLAMMSKYIVVVYCPLLFVAALLCRRQVAWVFALLVTLLSVAYVGYYRADLAVLYHSQIAAAHAANATYGEILEIAAWYLAPLSLLWAWAFYRSWTRPEFRSSPAMLGLFLVFAVPLIGYHLKSRDMISMYKHMVYGAVFLCPVGALLLCDLLRQCTFPRLSVGIVSCLLLAMTAAGFLQVKEMERAYPDHRPVLSWLVPRVDAQTTILSEDPYLFRHALFPTVRNGRMFEMTWFDNNMDGRGTAQDVIDAVWDGKFDYVYLNDVITPSLAKKLRTEVLHHKYEKVQDLPFLTSAVMSKNTTGSLSLYKSRERYQGAYPLNR
jgi:hypothetical protein